MINTYYYLPQPQFVENKVVANKKLVNPSQNKINATQCNTDDPKVHFRRHHQFKTVLEPLAWPQHKVKCK